MPYARWRTRARVRQRHLNGEAPSNRLACRFLARTWSRFDRSPGLGLVSHKDYWLILWTCESSSFLVRFELRIAVRFLGALSPPFRQPVGYPTFTIVFSSGNVSILRFCSPVKGLS
jgi:hypothetical protein